MTSDPSARPAAPPPTRMQQRWIFSLDDGNALMVYCPFGLSQQELSEVKEFLALFTRQAERYSIPEKEKSNAD